MKLYVIKKKFATHRKGFFTLLFLIVIGFNVAGALNFESSSQHFNAILTNSTDSVRVDNMMEQWYVEFIKYQDEGMDMNKADEKAMVMALRAYRLSTSVK